ncbi:MAG: hypothetical protein R2712_24265 [Vicinamibacterales bacterium]
MPIDRMLTESGLDLTVGAFLLMTAVAGLAGWSCAGWRPPCSCRR